MQYPYPTSPPPASALYLQTIPPPLHQLHPQRCPIKPRVLDDLDRARNPGVAVLVRLAVRLHLLQRLPQRLAGRGGVAVPFDLTRHAGLIAIRHWEAHSLEPHLRRRQRNVFPFGASGIHERAGRPSSNGFR